MNTQTTFYRWKFIFRCPYKAFVSRISLWNTLYKQIFLGKMYNLFNFLDFLPPLLNKTLLPIRTLLNITHFNQLLLLYYVWKSWSLTKLFKGGAILFYEIKCPWFLLNYVQKCTKSHSSWTSTILKKTISFLCIADINICGYCKKTCWKNKFSLVGSAP